MHMLVNVIFYCLLLAALIILSINDIRTRQIPSECIRFIFVLGVIRLLLDLENWFVYVGGFFSVSTMLFLLCIVSGGRLIGGGDVKMMAVCGMILGWKLIWAAFAAGCVLGLIIHSIYMMLSGADKSLAMGPYFSIGVILAAAHGEEFFVKMYEIL